MSQNCGMFKTALTKGHGHSNTFLIHATNLVATFFYHIYNIYYRTPPLPLHQKYIYLLYQELLLFLINLVSRIS